MRRSLITSAMAMATALGLTANTVSTGRASHPAHPAHRKPGGFARKANHYNARERARRIGGEMWRQHRLLDRIDRGLD